MSQKMCFPVADKNIFVSLLFLSILLVFGVNCDSYEESLWLKTLPSGHIHTHMEFVIRENKFVNPNHTRLFPRALSEIFLAHNIQELHFSLTQGYWRLESWGEPSIAAPTGALVSAWFLSDDERETDANWNGFTSRLSGLTCASLNFLDEKTSIEPMFSYRPEGKIVEPKNKKLFVRVGSLPKEHICTENLTPWTKLLPCGINRGIASLLRSKQVFNTHYHSAGIQYTQSDSEKILKLTLSLVFDRPSNARPSENLVRRIPGSLAIFPCYPTSKTTIKLWENGTWKNIEQAELNALKFSDLPQPNKEKRLIFTPMKYMGGYGQEYGEMIVKMTNHLSNTSLPVLYVEVLPWYIRPYLHTMSIDAKSWGSKSNLPVIAGDMFHYTPGKDRKALHKLEMDVIIPPAATVTLKFMIEKGHLKWDEYPPDANHGFYLEAAHFEVNYSNPNTGEQEKKHYYSRILLINLSTPDFSMPYNVICLTCTVVALAFGPIHNITTKRLQLKVMISKKEVFKRLWARIRGKKYEEVVDIKSNEDTITTENESVNEDKLKENGTAEESLQ